MIQTDNYHQLGKLYFSVAVLTIKVHLKVHLQRKRN